MLERKRLAKMYRPVPVTDDGDGAEMGDLEAGVGSVEGRVSEDDAATVE